ncbi:universal stress protein [Primorskyibacter sp. S187A]|uniref:universal stress protein n=1 Tax=Primorskyibacter sp. S187A TaxID=3415130 RepID=UPI003C7B7EF3
MYRKILVPMALDHGISAQTLEIARALTGGTGEIHALHVFEAPSGAAAAFIDDAISRKALERARALLEEKTAGIEGVEAHLINGHTHRAIIDFANERNVDCIVMGSHRPDLRDYLIGSTAARVVQHAPCAVHVHRSY